MYSENSLIVQAPISRIYELALAIENWPTILPHYRWVTILRDDGNNTRLAEMAATRDGIPVKWVSIQQHDPARHVIYYRHVRGVTRGMEVDWTFEPHIAGALVRIRHWFNPPWPRIVGPWAARYIVCDQFVHNIAGKTLHRVKELAEAQ